MKTRNNHKNQRAYVLVLAMIGLMTLMFFLMTGLSTSSSTVKVSGNYSKTVDSFNFAEVGLAKARPIIETADFDDLLTDFSDPGLPLIAKTAFNDGFYTVYVNDNDDGDSNLYDDDDNIIVVTSIGTNAVGGTVTIEAHLQKPIATDPVDLPGAPGAGRGAAMMCGTATNVATVGSAEIIGDDYDPPAFTCSGPSCDGTPIASGGPAIVGESAITSSGSGYTGAIVPSQSDTNCDEWRTLRDSLALLPAGDDVVTLSGTGINAPQNDCTDPKVFIINTSDPTFRFSGTASLCGVVIVASNTAIAAVGNVIIVGAVLIMGESATLNFVASSGTPRIFGQVIVQSTSVDTAKELEVKGTADIKLSTTGLGYATDAINAALSPPGGGGGSALMTIAWKETY